MEQQKKKRGENWSSEEKEILRQLIAQSANIIEDRSTKTCVNNLKIKEWKNILFKFNEITGKSRSVGELKLAWKRMKLSAKVHISNYRREQSKTGGGEKPPSPTPEELEIMAIAPLDFVIEVNDYDSDAVIPVTMATSAKEPYDPKPGPSYKETESTVTINEEKHILEAQDISNDPTDTKSDNSVKKSTAKKRKNILQNRSEEMRQSIIQSNTDFKKRQLEMMEEEHKYKIKIAKLTIKKIELEMAILESNKNTST